MHFVYAPMEGITGYIFRNVRRKYYDDVEAYYSPFLSPDQNQFCQKREYQDILPEHNEGIHLIPQIMTNNSRYFVNCAKELEKLGYQEVNMNLGCPSRTVFSKHRGAGMLVDIEGLDHYLEEIFSEISLPVSVKTRLGVDDPEEFYELLEVYNKYPFRKLILHPRVRNEFYKGRPHYDMYAYGVSHSRAPLCYNGNVFSVKDHEAFMERFPDTEEIMLGRGLLANPGLIGEIRTGEKTDGRRMKAFLDELLAAYAEIMPGEKPLLFKMKEQWYYMASLFPGYEKQIKKIRKAGHVSEYKAYVDQLFTETEPDTACGFSFA